MEHFNYAFINKTILFNDIIKLNQPECLEHFLKNGYTITCENVCDVLNKHRTCIEVIKKHCKTKSEKYAWKQGQVIYYNKQCIINK